MNTDSTKTVLMTKGTIYNGERLLVDKDYALPPHIARKFITSGRAVPAEDETETYQDMTVAELKTYAGDNDIDLGDVTKKADIIAAIELAEKE